MKSSKLNKRRFLYVLGSFFVAIGCEGQVPLPFPPPKAPIPPQKEIPLKAQQPGEVPLEIGDPNLFVKLAKKVVPSVVNISTSVSSKSPYVQGAPDDFFRKFFEEFFGGPGWEGDGEERTPPPRRGRPRSKAPKNLPKSVSLGTGFIVDASGLILTNNHVVADADEIKITFTEAPDEKPTDAEVAGRDPELDVALIRVKSKREMIPLVLGDSDALAVGEYVMAIGNPFGQGHSVTHGIISAKGRVAPQFPLATYLQTDAPINPGNSGGPLVNLKGEVIGINNAIDARAHGIGFAIPSNSVKQTLQQLRTKGSVSRGFIGVLVGELSPELSEKLGVSKDVNAPLVTSITPGGPAEKAGIEPYDIILEVNGKKVRTSGDLISQVTAIPVGESARLKILRNNKEKEVKIQIGKRPAVDGKKEKEGRPEKSSRMDTGMSLQELTPDMAREMGITGKASGVVVTDIDYDGPADKAGLNRGDIIVEVDRKPVKDLDSFYAIVKAKKSYLLRVRKMSPGQGQEVFAVVILDLKGD